MTDISTRVTMIKVGLDVWNFQLSSSSGNVDPSLLPFSIEQMNQQLNLLCKAMDSVFIITHATINWIMLRSSNDNRSHDWSMDIFGSLARFGKAFLVSSDFMLNAINNYFPIFLITCFIKI